MRFKGLLLFVFAFILLYNVQALPPVATTNSASSLQIMTNEYQFIKQNTAFEFHFRVSNNSDLLTDTTTNCNFYLTYQNNGEHTAIYQSMPYINNGENNYKAIINSSNFSKTGTYCYITECNSTSQSGARSACVVVTESGNETPQDVTIVFYTSIFLIILVTMTYQFITLIGHVYSLDFDMEDLAKEYGVFFALIGYSILQSYYLGNQVITGFIGMLINIGIFTNLVLPSIGFFITVVVGSWMQKRVKGVDYA